MLDKSSPVFSDFARRFCTEVIISNVVNNILWGIIQDRQLTIIALIVNQ